jgi:hypothetical protein
MVCMVFALLNGVRLGDKYVKRVSEMLLWSLCSLADAGGYPRELFGPGHVRDHEGPRACTHQVSRLSLATGGMESSHENIV